MYNLLIKGYWETNISEPSITTFLALCKILDMSDFYADYYGVNPKHAITTLNAAGEARVLEYIKLLYSTDTYRKVLPTMAWSL